MELKLELSYLAVLAAALTCISCENDSDISHNGNIQLSNVRTVAAVTKGDRTDSIPVATIGDECSDVFLSVSATTSAFADCDTKAGESVIGDLKCDNAFVIKGYLGDEIAVAGGATQEDRNNRNFMNTTVDYDPSDNLWHTVGEFKWRNKVTHHFWAYRGDVVDFNVNSSFTEAGFSYTSDGEEDLLVARASGFHQEGDSDILDGLTFNHALSAVGFDTDGIQYKVKGLTISDAPEGRCVINSIFIVVDKGGDCTVSGSGFSWTPDASSSIQQSVDINGVTDRPLAFVIPQSANTKAVVSIRDTQRELTFPLVLNNLGSSTLSYWDAGTKNIYNLSGTVKVPETGSQDLPGIDANFTGKDGKFQNKIVIEGLDVTYIKTIRVTWCGLANTNGNGTYSYVSYEGTDVTLNQDDYPATEDGLKSKQNIGFGYDHKAGTMLKGSTAGVDSVHGTIYEAILDFNDVTGPQNIYLVFVAGSAGSGTKWNVRNMNIEVTEFK